MPRFASNPALTRFFAEYGMLGVLLLLCVYYSWATFGLQDATGVSAGRVVATEIVRSVDKQAGVLILAGEGELETAFADAVQGALEKQGHRVIERVQDGPPGAAAAINRLVGESDVPGCIAASKGLRLVVEKRLETLPALADTRVVFPEQYWWPTFLNFDNLIDVANQTSVYAIIAIGMTMVIITGGIDLSVGSLTAFAAVVAASLVVLMGREQAGPLAVVCGCTGGVLVCAAIGALSGTVVTLFKIPPFITTLAVMLIARGLAMTIAGGRSIYELPSSFNALGGGKIEAMPFGYPLTVPYTVLLMFAMYGVAHLVMSDTTFGRHLYALGGNAQAARLSGVRSRRLVVAVYAICAALAGLGGVIMGSQLRSGDPNLGNMYELYVIAAVVVGGASLSGGEGKMFGTLIGAFIIAVIRNGMNLTGVGSYTQMVVLGLVILGAVLLDQLRKAGWRMPRE